MKKLIRKIVSVFPKPIRDLYFNYEDKWLYLFFGGLTTVVSFVAAGFAKWVLESWGNFDESAVSDISTVFSWVCAVTFAYLTNRVWVFDSKIKGAKNLIAEGGKFYGGRVFTLAVEWIIMRVGYAVMGLNYWLVKILANVIVLILNYVISKVFVFRKGKEEADG
ncbi:MAG: GtrA family protein [Ruminococcus sp.]|nr:GtrA family protein [Ruminococcus sp.]